MFINFGSDSVVGYLLELISVSSVRAILDVVVGTLAAVRELLGRGASVADLLALHGLEGLVREGLDVSLRRRELTTCRRRAQLSCGFKINNKYNVSMLPRNI